FSYCLYTATSPTTFYTLSLHDALPISHSQKRGDIFISNLVDETRIVFQKPLIPFLSGTLMQHCLEFPDILQGSPQHVIVYPDKLDRKSTRLNSSHVSISYAVFCLKKKK